MDGALMVADVEARPVDTGKVTLKAIKLQTLIYTASRARGPQLLTGRDVYDACRGLGDLDREAFVTLTLNQRNRLIGAYIVSLGTMSASLVHPREVLRPAVIDGAAAVIFVHNHPSGNPAPSMQDRELTDRLKNASTLLGIRLVDHTIIGRPETGSAAWCSFAERGWL